MDPEVSVVIPAYNRAERLERAVRSVLEQQGVRFELLVVDDASEEPAEALYRDLEELGHRVIRQERNIVQHNGAVQAHNRGSHHRN